MRARVRCIGCVVAVALAALVLSVAAPAAEPVLRPDEPYRAARGDAVSYEVDFSAVVTPPYGCRVLKVWMPLPQSDAGQQITGSRLSTFPEHVEPQLAEEEVYGNRFAYFEFHDPHGAQIVRHRFTAKVRELNWDVDPSRVRAVDAWPRGFARYLRGGPLDDSRLYRDVLRALAPAGRAGAGSLFRAMRWIDDQLTYDHGDASLRADPVHAFTRRHGHCSDYHGLCAAMGRSLGYPTRVTYGINVFPKNSPSHCKLEAYLPPYGWVSFDLSETQKLVQRIEADPALDAQARSRLAEAARRRLRRGFRDNTWLLVTKGTDYELAPKASRPVRVVRTIYAEADGEPLPDPDPADAARREYGWMTVHSYKPDRRVTYPFRDIASLDDQAAREGDE